MPVDIDPLAPNAGSVAIRLYGQGLGDCFLLAFPRTDGTDKPCYMLIDCGVAKSTPGGKERMRSVVKAVAAATGGHLDVLAITHQHYDHISSFVQVPEEWDQITVGAIYLPWTEGSDDHREAKTARDLRDALNKAAEAAVRRAGPSDSAPALRREAAFLGVDTDGSPGDTAGSGGALGIMDQAMEAARAKCPGNIHFLEPGDVVRLPGTDTHAYVLGPPLPSQIVPSSTPKAGGKPYVELLVDDSHMYHYDQFPGMEPDSGRANRTGRNIGEGVMMAVDSTGIASLASAITALDDVSDSSARSGDEVYCPFGPENRIEWDQAMSLNWFQNHYGNQILYGENGTWRRVDNDWLSSASSLALRAGGFTNNISLVLAFDIPGSDKMLLFPGDAQVGNWLSWHTIKSWRMIGDARPENPPASRPASDANAAMTLMENLLGRIAFYKAGHHASHNATIRQRGLELMTRKDLVAYIPVSVGVAQDMMGYCPMPFYPVVRRLQEVTRGRVFLANGKAVEPPPDGETQSTLLAKSGMAVSKDRLPAMTDKAGIMIEDACCLYMEATVKA